MVVVVGGGIYECFVSGVGVVCFVVDCVWVLL